jgi:hypothetical protein
MWTKLNRQVFRQEEDKIWMLSSDERQKFRIIASRLSYTKPNIVADAQRVMQSKIPGTNATRAWRGAVNVLGSAYCQSEQNKQKKRSQRKPSDTPKGQAPPIPAIFQATPAKETSVNPTVPLISPVHILNTYSKPKNRAVEAEKDRPQSARLMIALKLEKPDTKTPNDLAFEQVKAMITHYQKNDPTTASSHGRSTT